MLSLGMPLRLRPRGGVLDQTGTIASGAYATRRLRSAYVGNCLRGRRTSDNSEMDFGFIGDNLNLSALLAFAGGSNVHVVTWYDQSGNNRNCTQPTTTLQPRIVNAGVVETLSGRPALNFLQLYYMLYTVPRIQPLTTSLVVKQNSKAAGRHFIDGLNASPRILVTGDTIWRFFAGGAIPVVGVNSDLNNRIITNTFKDAASQMYVNSVNVLNFNPGTGAMGAQILGAGGGGVTPTPFNGLIAEHIVFPDILPLFLIQNLERNQSSYYSITLP